MQICFSYIIFSEGITPHIQTKLRNAFILLSVFNDKRHRVARNKYKPTIFIVYMDKQTTETNVFAFCFQLLVCDDKRYNLIDL